LWQSAKLCREPWLRLVAELLAEDERKQQEERRRSALIDGRTTSRN
jgi:hypothetical protein